MIPLQWGHVNEDVEEASLPETDRGTHESFNGATSMKTWKRARLPDRLEQKT